MVVHRLHRQPTAFIGREQEVADLTELIVIGKPDCRLLTLVGPGGIGKTRLAIKVAEILDSFQDGVYFVPFQPLTSIESIVPTIATSLNFQFHGGGEPRQQLLSYLRERSVLQLLDNCEHLLEGMDVVDEILDFAPYVKLLATSREILNLHEEYVRQVEGLLFLDGSTEGLREESDALRLFVECVQRVRGDPTPSSDYPCAVRICQLVEGMPLAIELAAAQFRTLPCMEVAENIESNLDSLTVSLRNMPERHRSMRAVFDWSWQLLNTEQQAVLKRLSVFRGGFTHEAAEQVAGATLATLISLVDKSMVRSQTDGRYDMHELLRQYAEEQLNAQLVEYTETQSRHTRYFANWLYEIQQEMMQLIDINIVSRIAIEQANVEIGGSRALQRGTLVEYVLKYVRMMSVYYQERGLFQYGEQVFRASAGNQ